jgi:microcystin-dependent protein
MPEPMIGEIRMFAGSFAPAGWAFCDGQLIPISENDALFTLIGTTYGGDGQSTFALPNLQSRVPMHAGNGFILAEAAGVESVTLTTQQIPIHTHALLGSGGTASDTNPGNNLLATLTSIDGYVNATPTAPMAPQAISPVGGSQPHTNIQPYLCISFIISLFGVFPRPN